MYEGNFFQFEIRSTKQSWSNRGDQKQSEFFTTRSNEQMAFSVTFSIEKPDTNIVYVTKI